MVYLSLAVLTLIAVVYFNLYITAKIIKRHRRISAISSSAITKLAWLSVIVYNLMFVGGIGCLLSYEDRTGAYLLLILSGIAYLFWTVVIFQLITAHCRDYLLQDKDSE